MATDAEQLKLTSINVFGDGDKPSGIRKLGAQLIDGVGAAVVGSNGQQIAVLSLKLLEERHVTSQPVVPDGRFNRHSPAQEPPPPTTR